MGILTLPASVCSGEVGLFHLTSIPSVHIGPLGAFHACLPSKDDMPGQKDFSRAKRAFFHLRLRCLSNSTKRKPIAGEKQCAVSAQNAALFKNLVLEDMTSNVWKSPEDFFFFHFDDNLKKYVGKKSKWFNQLKKQEPAEILKFWKPMWNYGERYDIMRNETVVTETGRKELRGLSSRTVCRPDITGRKEQLEALGSGRSSVDCPADSADQA